MNQITPFSFDSHPLRTAVGAGDAIFFVAADVAEILGYSETSKLLSHCKHPTVLGDVNKINVLHPSTKWIPESDLYRGVMRSNMPAADKFQDWVCEEVLPTIRKTGSYGQPSLQDMAAALVPVLVETLRPLLATSIRAEVAMHRVSIRDGETSGQVWKRHKLQTKGMRGYSSWFGNRLASRGCCVADGGKAEVGGIASRMFDPDLCDKAMKANNGALLHECQQYVQGRNGQGSLI